MSLKFHLKKINIFIYIYIYIIYFFYPNRKLVLSSVIGFIKQDYQEYNEIKFVEIKIFWETYRLVALGVS